MPCYSIETLIGETRCLDRNGTEFVNSDAAIRTAFFTLLDIVQDESELQDDVDVSVCVRDAGGQPIFTGLLRTLRAEAADRRAALLLGAEKRPEPHLQSA